ncbi:hypothetical protein [Metabacillus halosaccharovorans]|uniref:hypothetical protein n=1 Tax=Metabacillus halosaccharovorans TaxID=930124 RepID=UPI00147667C9|nr:hypothetical protein [Metabacillus halosaccharovorans]
MFLIAGLITSIGLRLYIGSYHIVGKLVEGEYFTGSEWDEEYKTLLLDSRKS